MEMRKGAMKGTARVKGRVRAITVNIFCDKNYYAVALGW